MNIVKETFEAIGALAIAIFIADLIFMIFFLGLDSFKVIDFVDVYAGKTVGILLLSLATILTSIIISAMFDTKTKNN